MVDFRDPEDRSLPIHNVEFNDDVVRQDQPPLHDDTEEEEEEEEQALSVYPVGKYDSIMQETHPQGEQRSMIMVEKTASPAPAPRHTMDDYQAVRIDPKDRRFETFHDTEPIEPHHVRDLQRFGPAKILPTPVSHEIERHAAHPRPDPYPSEYGEAYGDEAYHPIEPSSYNQEAPGGSPGSAAGVYEPYGLAEQYADTSWDQYAPREDAGESYGEPAAFGPAAPAAREQYPWSSADGYEGWPKDGGGYALPQRGTDRGSHDMGVPQVSVDGGVESPKGSSSGSDSLMTEHCKEFHLKELAEHIVKGTLRTAVQDLSYERAEDWRYRTAGTEGPNVEWPSNYGFTSVDGERKIDEFLDSWGIGDAWYHCVDFLYKGSDVYADYYYYEAKWSIPTRPYPIPQATVSVFFTIEVSRKKPEECPVDVKFQFETDPYVHTPGECKIREEWISDTLKRKIAFFRALNF